MRLFVSYAHADQKQIKTLSKHLTILGQRGYIQPWDDRQLVAGEEWEERIFTEMTQADIVVLLYSTESRASEFIQKKEAPRAVKLRREKGCKLIVVPLGSEGLGRDFRAGAGTREAPDGDVECAARAGFHAATQRLAAGGAGDPRSRRGPPQSLPPINPARRWERC
jgi:TIR domain